MTLVKSSNSRVWLFDGGAGPFTEPMFMGCAKIGDPSWPQGDVTSIKCPSVKRFGEFETVGEIRGAQDRVTVQVTNRYPLDLSDLLALTRKRCRVDVQAHIGMCADPQSYKTGWEKIVHFRSAFISNYAPENFGALSDDENNPTNEVVDLSAIEMYEIVKMTFGEKGHADTVREIYTIDVCDNISCGECGPVSDGCQAVFASMEGVGATPGTKPSLLYSADGAQTFYATPITTLFSNEVLDDGDCIGDNLVLVSNMTNSLHYADTSDILSGTETWTEVNAGFVGGGEPNAVWSVDPRNTWIVGDGGYVYFTSDPTAGVTVQDAGIAAINQDLKDVHAYDTQNVLAVGVLNAVIYTTNGGDTWQSVIGPAVGVTLNTCWMLSPITWLVGDANGALWATNNSGTTWTEVALPASVTQIDALVFVDDVVGFMAVRIGANGYLMRTTSGGEEWYFLPETGTITTSDYYNDLAICDGLHNILYAAGSAAVSTIGLIVKGVGS